jgi:hypothetical protein
LRWSDPADETNHVWWEYWFAITLELIHVSIERCLFPEETEIVNSQLHVFEDALEDDNPTGKGLQQTSAQEDFIRTKIEAECCSTFFSRCCRHPVLYHSSSSSEILLDGQQLCA